MNHRKLNHLLDDAEYLADLILEYAPNFPGAFRETAASMESTHALLEEIEQKYSGFSGLTQVCEVAEATALVASGHSIK